MPLPPDLPVVDHHCHLSPSGEGIEAARRFRKAGGTHLFLATQSYEPGPITSLAAYERQFDTTERLARALREQADVVAYSVLAPYPIDLLRAAEAIGAPGALDLQRQAIDLAGRRVRDGRAVALGEVGRAHFTVAPELRAAVDEAFLHALGVARDVGCPAVIHSEDLDDEGIRGLARLASSVGFPLGRLVKHYQRSLVAPELRGEVVPSYLARRELCESSIRTGGPWFWETDFLDDPARPGAVLDLETVPRRAKRVVESEGAAGVERLRTPFVDAVASVYGFRPELSERPAG